MEEVEFHSLNILTVKSLSRYFFFSLSSDIIPLRTQRPSGAYAMHQEVFERTSLFLLRQLDEAKGIFYFVHFYQAIIKIEYYSSL